MSSTPTRDHGPKAGRAVHNDPAPPRGDAAMFEPDHCTEVTSSHCHYTRAVDTAGRIVRTRIQRIAMRERVPGSADGER